MWFWHPESDGFPLPTRWLSGCHAHEFISWEGPSTVHLRLAQTQVVKRTVPHCQQHSLETRAVSPGQLIWNLNIDQTLRRCSEYQGSMWALFQAVYLFLPVPLPRLGFSPGSAPPSCSLLGMSACAEVRKHPRQGHLHRTGETRSWAPGANGANGSRASGAVVFWWEMYCRRREPSVTIPTIFVRQS